MSGDQQSGGATRGGWRAVDRGERDLTFDVAKGIGMILVVLGHAMIGVEGALGETHGGRAALIVIYAFHMPLFMLLSGSFGGRAVSEAWPRFGGRMLRTVVHPYLVWSLVLLGSHYVMSSYTNAPVEKLDLLSILYAPPSVMWFLYYLGVFFVAYRLLSGIHRYAPAVVGGALFVVSFAAGLDETALVHLRHFGPFAVGVLVGPKRLRSISGKGWLTSGSVMVLGATAWLAWREAAAPLEVYLAIRPEYAPAALAGIQASLAAALAIAEAGALSGWLGAGLGLVGRNTLPIFVSHILLTAGARIGLLQLGVDDRVIMVVGALALGLVLPMIAKRLGDLLRISWVVGWWR